MRTALITGCSKPDGIGWNTALQLSKAGVRVVVSDIAGTEQGLASLVAAIRETGQDAAQVCGDVSVESEAIQMVREAATPFSRLDILVNNAAAPHGEDRLDIEQVPLAAWERLMSINTRGVFLMCRAAIGEMRRNRWGRIVNVASAVVRYGGRNISPYAATKGAVVGFTRSLAMDLARDGITVNAVCPGSVLTSRALSTTGRLFGADQLEKGLAARALTIPAGRHGVAEDVAGAVAFLCSDAASYITGADLYVDGGGLPFPVFKAPVA